jgi:hypothetical protein
MDFIVTISGDAVGPFDIYYDTVSGGTLVDSNVSRASLLGGYPVTITGSPVTIIVVNTDSDCQNSEVFYLATPTPTPTPVATATPTPTPTFVLNCTIFGGSVTFVSSTPTPTPTITLTPTATPTLTPTPTPTPTGTLVRHRAQLVLDGISPSSVFEVSNSTSGGTIDNISIVSPGTSAFGKNDSYILAGGASNTVIYRIRKTATGNTALDAGSVVLYLNGNSYQGYNFNLGDVIDFYITVDITTSDLVSIQILEG